MYCTHCGRQLAATDRYCAQCGVAQRGALPPPAARRLYRPLAGRKISGVAQGFAEYMDMDVTVMRLLWVGLTLLSGGVVLLVYIIAWMVMPSEEDLPRAAA